MPEERMILLGDACNSFTFMFEDYSTSIEMYKKSLIFCGKNSKRNMILFLLRMGTEKAVRKLLTIISGFVEKIMGGTSDRVPMEFQGYHGLIADKEAAPGRGNIVLIRSISSVNEPGIKKFNQKFEEKL